ncbi:hypothetical protein AGLY_004262 [Aphis glycines]|uniref:Uncharacterized protein n=1 Tax=Aphis glycines TaxID=307491 RepID=A0A6G0U013_APHGL|nr:hypothetical protein AGLY_004262 [Aphis glycines]
MRPMLRQPPSQLSKDATFYREIQRQNKSNNKSNFLHDIVNFKSTYNNSNIDKKYEISLRKNLGRMILLNAEVYINITTESHFLPLPSFAYSISLLECLNNSQMARVKRRGIVHLGTQDGEAKQYSSDKDWNISISDMGTVTQRIYFVFISVSSQSSNTINLCMLNVSLTISQNTECKFLILLYMYNIRKIKFIGLLLLSILSDENLGTTNRCNKQIFRNTTIKKLNLNLNIDNAIN